MNRFVFLAQVFAVALFGAAIVDPAVAQDSLAETIATCSPKIVKIFGAGGRGGLEAYQSGMLVSSQGHVLTAWSYVLDVDDVTVTLADGRRMTGELVGIDPTLEIAVLKTPATDTPFFDLKDRVALEPGARIVALSNLYGVARGDEAASAQRGIVAGKTSLAAKRGAFRTPWQGEVYLLDAVTNNPGAAGGAVVDRKGRIVATLGKELKNAADGTWLNYALPIDVVAESVEKILAGQTIAARSTKPVKPARPHTLAVWGVKLVPEVLTKTPPYIDAVTRASPAALADLRPDDLILFVNDRLTPTSKALAEEISTIPLEKDKVRLMVQRGVEVREVVIDLSARPTDDKKPEGAP